MKAAPQEMVIGKLNPVIRGWANYHCHVVSSRIFSAMDHRAHAQRVVGTYLAMVLSSPPK